MAEYIVEGAEPNNTVLKGVTRNGYEHESWLPVREEIVRCRDCRKAYKADEVFFCKMLSVTVEPWRFCSWGEPEQPFAE